MSKKIKKHDIFQEPTNCVYQDPKANDLNHHRQWWCGLNHIEIRSNDDVLGNKFYLIDPKFPDIGEHEGLIWYPTPTAAAIAYYDLGKKAVNKMKTKKELKTILAGKKQILNLTIAGRANGKKNHSTIAALAIDIYNTEQEIENMTHKLG